MSMNWSTFRKRSLTAVAFVAIMLTGLLWNEWSFFILFSLVHAGCWIEYHQINRRMLPGYASLHILFMVGLVITGWSISWFFYKSVIDNENFLISGGLLLCIGVFALLGGFFLSLKAGVKAMLRAFFGILYISLSFGLLMHLRSGAVFLSNVDGEELYYAKLITPNIGYWLPVILIGSIWVNDTMAYVVGSFFGKTPLSEISPKKTWEGTVGGIYLAVIIAYVAGRLSIGPAVALYFMAIAYIAAVTGTIGDLFESKLKRLAGVKDSGTIMPGHGGFLDRFDSLLFATPFVWLYLRLIA
jgi:phosphatidate cytidylyltransferase